ncbi:growth hormone secretagogue receptor type 1-like isoform X1 [Rhagoletis pomonella]|uniref:growth hormone secretagogue receptor type 1-like isoform X1 n=2 Tax=Rhagoletis pomonella TaxID=28610 RepID=UPI001786E65B|nr:growth hormone secretagogue receptor type 1-like isoform X1 [Rhagoletis pomonella]
MCFCIAIMTLGVIGNIMVPIVIVKTKDMRNSTNIFLTNLSIADLLVLLVCTPTVLVEVNTRPETWVLGHAMCKAVPFVELTVAHASVLTILAISFERYYAICEPLKAGYVCTKARAILICILAWCIAAGFTSPIIWVADYKYVEYIDGSSVAVCLTQAVTNWTMGYFLMTISTFFILPLLILVVLYAIIAKNLISSNGPMLRIRPSKPELSLKARKQVVLMLGAVVLSFFLCLLPFRMLTMWIILSSEQTFFDIGVERYYSLLYFCRIMFYLNSAINPILYNLMSTKFRKGFLRLILNAWHGAAMSLTCGCHRRIRARTGTITGVGTNTNTNTSNTATSNATSSSLLSRQSNRRYSDDTIQTNASTRRPFTKTQIQIQMHMPCGMESEILAMLHSSVTAVAATALAIEDEALEKKGIAEDGQRKYYTIRKYKTQSIMREQAEAEQEQLPVTKCANVPGRRSVHVSFDDEEAIILT